MKPYQFVLRQEAVLAFEGCSKAEREILLRRFYFLAAYPEHIAQEVYSGEHGEEIRIQRFGRWRITYQIDSPVRQVHIIEIKKIAQ